jgi:hypothetical protein
MDTNANTRLVIASDSIGSANYELGCVLMTSFFMNLAEVATPPLSIHFLNEGARLTGTGSRVLDFIRRLEERGVTITTCRTCLEYLDIEDELGVGAISTMFSTVDDLMGDAHTLVID